MYPLISNLLASVIANKEESSKYFTTQGYIANFVCLSKNSNFDHSLSCIDDFIAARFPYPISWKPTMNSFWTYEILNEN